MQVTVTGLTTDEVIPPIKTWRQITAKGLKEAKEDVDRLRAGGTITLDVPESSVKELENLFVVEEYEPPVPDTYTAILFKLRLLVTEALDNNHTKLAEDILHAYNENMPDDPPPDCDELPF